jgi:hypothetical protein
LLRIAGRTEKEAKSFFDKERLNQSAAIAPKYQSPEVYIALWGDSTTALIEIRDKNII